MLPSGAYTPAPAQDMVKKHDEIMEMVTTEVKKDPNVSLPTLTEKAQKIDSSVKELSSRQFNARYPLQVKRKLSGAKGGRKPGSRKSRKAAQTQASGGRRRKAPSAGGNREELRKVFFEFAREFADAETKTEIVGVLNKVESYSERVEKIFS